MIWLLYYTLTYLMVAGIGISSLWNPKSKEWIRGRQNWAKRIHQLPAKKGFRIWFHVSSLGEFEQARPVIEKLKATNSNIDIFLTFFSPSGFSIRQHYPHATVQYLPADLPGNATKWLNCIQPDMAVFVKYDLWPGYLKTLENNRIPAILISAHWTPGTWFNSRNLAPTKSLLRKFTKIFLQNDEHLKYFIQRGWHNLSVAGDTRIDRCLELPAETRIRLPPLLAQTGPYDLIAGSTWPPDEKLIISAIHQFNIRVLIAPHDVSADNIHRLVKTFPFEVIRLSELNEAHGKPRVVIIDNIGLLSVLYPLGKIAYIGGGFGSGIHNILEPMAHQKPVIFGPAYKKFVEAIAMVSLKAGFTILNAHELYTVLENLLQSGSAEKAGKMGFDYMIKQQGASLKVAQYILDSIPYSSKDDNNDRTQPGQ